jgi:16S rRNA (guanine966-N2)-methyltransferase
MRVVGGELGGRRFTAPRGRATRPTSERAREAVFSILGDISGDRVLDLFAGSGAFGIEALSRGAAQAIFVDNEIAAIRTILENVSRLGLGQRAIVSKADIAKGPLPVLEQLDLVFVDPPYLRASEFGPLLTHALPPLLRPGARVVSESDRRSPLELGLPLSLERRYGDTLIRIHQHNEI